LALLIHLTYICFTDAWSYWNEHDKNSKQNDEEVKEATLRLHKVPYSLVIIILSIFVKVLIPEVAKELDAKMADDTKVELSFFNEIVSTLHSAGVNLRHLGKFFHLSLKQTDLFEYMKEEYDNEC
jgi:hypothetical protein